jgi:hypothetical protein
MYQLTEEGFRLRFRDSKPDRGDTVFQFVARLMRYFSRWIELSEIGSGLEELKDLLIREQFIQVCSTNSGAIFNRMMRKLLVGLEEAENYVDDILEHTVR